MAANLSLENIKLMRLASNTSIFPMSTIGDMIWLQTASVSFPHSMYDDDTCISTKTSDQSQFFVEFISYWLYNNSYSSKQ